MFEEALGNTCFSVTGVARKYEETFGFSFPHCAQLCSLKTVFSWSQACEPGIKEKVNDQMLIAWAGSHWHKQAKCIQVTLLELHACPIQDLYVLATIIQDLRG